MMDASWKFLNNHCKSLFLDTVKDLRAPEQLASYLENKYHTRSIYKYRKE